LMSLAFLLNTFRVRRASPALVPKVRLGSPAGRDLHPPREWDSPPAPVRPDQITANHLVRY
ncbi:MAG: hypothetical protein N3D16_01580, partial [Anaerolineales bacterium]|nr:hypothetical protein [Anaerolineales bacterium]